MLTHTISTIFLCEMMRKSQELYKQDFMDLEPDKRKIIIDLVFEEAEKE